MKRRLLELISPAMRWHLFALMWLAMVAACAVLIVFRAIKNSAIAQMIQFRDVPLLDALDKGYATFYDLAATLAGAVVMLQSLVCFLAIRRALVMQDAGLRKVPGGMRRLTIEGWGAWLASLALSAATLISSAYTLPEQGASPSVPRTGALDWLAVVAAAVGGWLLCQWIARLWDDRVSTGDILRRSGHDPGEIARPLDTSPLAEAHRSTSAAGRWGAHAFQLVVVYLLCCASIVVYAAKDHLRFWDPQANGGYFYGEFFLPDELSDANWVLYSTSLLFASIAASLGCAAYVGLRGLMRGPRREAALSVAWTALLVAAVWAIVAGLPWQMKLWPEIRAEHGWIMPVVILVFTTAGFAPLIAVSGLMLRRDFLETSQCVRYVGFAPVPTVEARRYPRPIELVLWMLLFFPVYPYLRFFRWRRGWANYAALMLAIAALVTGGTLLVNKVDEWFTFEVWRGMLRAGQFPCLKVFLSLLSAAWVYACGQRAMSGGWALLRGAFHTMWRDEPSWLARGVDAAVRWGTRLLLAAVAGVCLAAATWPFWGWRNIRENVFTRLAEYNSRYQFELGFLHWLFDFDGDGYCALLHGADPDDFNSSVQAGGMAPPEVAAIPIDEFAVADPQKAQSFPNFVLLFLEGIVPRSLSCYGYRHLAGGLKATPHIDSVAAEGTRFTQCRCYYPSTWDAWFSTMSGRFTRIAEFDASIPFGDRYSRYANMYKVLKLAGTRRWCHPDCSAFPELFVPPDLQACAFQPHEEFQATLSDDDRRRDVWLGDQRVQRITEFIDSLKPGEKFFLCEHMSDTHFPWNRTSDERAAELGFAQGLQIYEADAELINAKGETYRNDQFCRYYQTITRMDAQVGVILNKLKQKKLYDNTVIIILSDHGCQFWEHEHLYYVSRIYEQALLVPLIVRVPGLPGDRVCHETVLQTDVLATLMDLAGVRLTNPRHDYPMTNHTLVPLLRGTSTGGDHRRYRERDVPLTTHFDRHGVISNFQYKLIFDRTTGTCSLFSLTDDLRHYGPELTEAMESRNLVDERPELRQQMLAKLRKVLSVNKSIIGQIERAQAE